MLRTKSHIRALSELVQGVEFYDPRRLVPGFPTPLFSSSAIVSRVRTASSGRVASISVVYSSSSSSTDLLESSFAIPYVHNEASRSGGSEADRDAFVKGSNSVHPAGARSLCAAG